MYDTFTHAGKGEQWVWHFDPSLNRETPAEYVIADSDGETLEVTLGEAQLFPCSGFVREILSVSSTPQPSRSR